MDIITAKLDVTKVDKAKLFPGKNGANYLDIVLIPSKSDKYGDDYMVVQSVTKEEREAGKRGAILGNAKILASRQAARPEPKDAPTEESDSVPF